MSPITRFFANRPALLGEGRKGHNNSHHFGFPGNRCGVLRLWSMIAVLMVSGGCSTPADPLSGVHALVLVSRPVFKVADTTTIQVVITNNGTKSVNIDVGCGSFFEITNGSAIVAPGYVSCPSVYVPPRTLGAGETYSETYLWHGETNYQTGAITNLVAGFYSVNAAFPVNEHYVVRSEAVPLQILSGIFN